MDCSTWPWHLVGQQRRAPHNPKELSPVSNTWHVLARPWGQGRGFPSLWVPSLVLPLQSHSFLPWKLDTDWGGHTFTRRRGPWGPAMLPGPGVPCWELRPRATLPRRTCKPGPHDVSPLSITPSWGLSSRLLLEPQDRGLRPLRPTYQMPEPSTGIGIRQLTLCAQAQRLTPDGTPPRHLSQHLASGQGLLTWASHTGLRWASSSH